MTVDDYPRWTAVIARARLGIGLAELHGSISGFLCCGWSGRPRELLASLELPPAATGADADLQALVGRAADRIAARARAGDPFEILLPDASLARRAEAMVDWCRGFLGGFGLTGVAAGRDADPAIRGLLDDLGRVAATHLTCREGDRAALEEILDFIRASVARLHRACSPAVPP